MTRTRTLELGVEEWSCTECGRRLLMRRPPAFEQLVLERGDEWAAHVGGAGGVQVAAVKASTGGQGGPSAPELGWLADHGIDWC
jgi:hypothetical protein